MPALDADERNRIIGDNIRKYRLLKGLTQDELADGICSVSQLSKVENGKTYIKRELLRMMADRLSVTVERIETTDALLDELTETLQWANDARTAGNLDKAFELVQEVIERSKEFGYQNLYVEGVYLHCSLLNQTHKYEQVIEIIHEIFEQEQLQDSTQKVMFWLEPGMAYDLNGNMIAAYDCYCRADDEFEFVDGNLEMRLRILFFLAKCHFWMQNDRTALRYAEKSEQLAKQLNKYVIRIRSSYAKASVLERLGEGEKAEKIFLSTLKEAQDNSLLVDVGLIHNNFGELLRNRGDLVQAKTHLQRAKKVFELLDEKNYLAAAVLQLAEVEFSEGEFSKADEYIQKVLAIVALSNGKVYLKKARALQVLGWIKEAEGDTEQYVKLLQDALEIYDQHHVVFEAYEVAVELANRLHELADARAVTFYRKAIEYNQKSLEFGRRR